MKNKEIYIKNIVKIIIEIYGTEDIYKLCSYFNIIVFYCDFKNQKGIIKFFDNKVFIGINKNLPMFEQRKVLIHEFAHFILHRKKLKR